MIKVRRVGYAAFVTPDLDHLVDYYTQVIGLRLVANEPHRAFLASKVGHLALELGRGDRPGCVKLAFDVGSDINLDDAARILATDGITSERRSDAAPGVPEVLAFVDPKGTAIELFASCRELDAGDPLDGVGPMKLGHVAFGVTDPEKMVAFYTDVLGFRVSDWIEDFFVFMRCNPDHHSVNFLRGKHDRFDHIAFELKDWAEIQMACDVLGRKKLPLIWGPVRVGPGHNVAIYHRNPDDQIVELFAELDQMKDEALGYFDPRPWHVDRPQRPKVWKREHASIWGLPPTPDFYRGRDDKF